ncbi:M48 family metallopeptidase [Methanoregula sp.]|uniref:M48 family metallopeptidase n=1 Tax=Methanoregula sp. TaxID=2052170 RepID=UPI003568F6B4
MDDIPIEKIIRSRRRSIALIITPSARLIVRAPLRAPSEVINAVIQEKEGWIRKKLAEMKGRPQATVHRYEEGEIFYFLGRAYPLHIVDDGRAAIERTDRLCVSCTLEPEIAGWIQRWYVLEAEKEIRSRCMWFSMTTGYTPASIRISNARGRWGSCTSKGGISFSWCLVQAPMEIVDYVVVHELVHLAHHNHSRQFWDRVREIMPDYERRRKWLRENERLLRI